MNFILRKEKLFYNLLSCFGFNPFTPKGSPFDEWNRLVLDRVKSIKSLLGVKGLRTSPFYDPPFWGLYNIDPPPLPAWDKSNWHKLKERLKTVWNISLLGGLVGELWCRRKVSVSCRLLAIIVLPIKTARMLLASVMQANPAPGLQYYYFLDILYFLALTLYEHFL